MSGSLRQRTQQPRPFLTQKRHGPRALVATQRRAMECATSRQRHETRAGGEEIAMATIIGARRRWVPLCVCALSHGAQACNADPSANFLVYHQQPCLLL